MFTGIVAGLAQIKAIEKKEDLSTLVVKFPQGALKGLQKGASIALNGCCLTVTQFDELSATAYFDVMIESLRRTNLGEIKTRDHVNYERAAKFGDEVGGHFMSGHISGTVVLLERKQTETNCELIFSLENGMSKYLLPKGYVGLNGCSLTIGPAVTDRFSVFLIPETLSVTVFGDITTGTKVNLEIDTQTQAIVDTVENYMKAREI
jgi:riboflavin synthase